MKTLLKLLIRITKPLIWRIATAYDLRVDRPLYAYGQNPLIFEGGLEDARKNIPKSVYFNTRSGRIVVGAHSVFGDDVKVLTGKHINVEEASRQHSTLHQVPETGRDIRIGTGCKIGTLAIIIGPVEIGDFVVIGAGSVVTKNVPPYSFVAGVPARVIRTLNEGQPTE